MANELIIRKVSELDLTGVIDDEVLFEIKDTIVDNINMKKLREAVTGACMNLSQVGEPTWYADMEVIAMDNQQRLNIVFQLLRNLDIFEKDVANMKKNKYGCADDGEKVLGFVSNTKNLVDAVVQYGEFKQKEHIENMKLLEENKRRYLEGGEQ